MSKYIGDSPHCAAVEPGHLHCSTTTHLITISQRLHKSRNHNFPGILSQCNRDPATITYELMQSCVLIQSFLNIILTTELPMGG